jgi:hypothetical protein
VKTKNPTSFPNRGSVAPKGWVFRARRTLSQPVWATKPNRTDIKTAIHARCLGLSPTSLRLARVTAPKAIVASRKRADLAAKIVQKTLE